MILLNLFFVLIIFASLLPPLSLIMLVGIVELIFVLLSMFAFSMILVVFPVLSILMLTILTVFTLSMPSISPISMLSFILSVFIPFVFPSFPVPPVLTLTLLPLSQLCLPTLFPVLADNLNHNLIVKHPSNPAWVMFVTTMPTSMLSQTDLNRLLQILLQRSNLLISKPGLDRGRFSSSMDSLALAVFIRVQNSYFFVLFELIDLEVDGGDAVFSSGLAGLSRKDSERVDLCL